MTDHYAVMGCPIAHSRSPQIHRLFAKQTDQALKYDKLEVSPENFKQALTDFFHQGGKGLNITVPLKNLAYESMDELSEAAQRAQAVNTVSVDNAGKLTGHNTDGTGLIRDLKNNNQVVLADKNILVLGAGGAVQGILQPLLTEKPAKVLIANRTLQKAEKLAGRFSDLGNMQACSLNELSTEAFDIIINGTSTGLSDQVPDIPETLLKPGGVTYDMMYADKPTAFVRWGQSHGAAKALDGLGMLIEQAAEAFYIWRNKRPDTQDVINTLSGMANG